MDEVEVAIECTKAVAEAADGDVRRRYAQRCRAFHAEIFTLGVAHVVALAAARAGAKAVEAGLRHSTCGEVVKAALAEAGGPEEKSYGLYGAVLLYAMRRRGYVKSTTLLDALGELKDPALNAAAYRAAEWLKRLAEAYFKA
ncbi:type III-B CRISPR module-associated protein Cmr5 [Pyrobaculum calidifontis]|uniref:type III-B CRISPR module-associated protein Cmr5 n=1 Tax=Pyrobaculum calidifontis TaxID=181486 RepID=UPI000324B326|nr:type III-B CRISPR module-associated protein Cmr5 [Pyrobaculum calidifontis]